MNNVPDQPDPEVLARIRERVMQAHKPIVCFVGKAAPFNPDDPENNPEWQGWLCPPNQEE